MARRFWILDASLICIAVFVATASSQASSQSLCGSSSYPIVLRADSTIQTFTSPGYPNKYPVNTKCQWLIVSPNNASRVILAGIYELEGLNCEFDNITIYTGNSTSMSHWEASWCDVGDSTRVSTGPNVTVAFSSDSTVPMTGFVIGYVVVATNTNLSTSYPRTATTSPAWYRNTTYTRTHLRPNRTSTRNPWWRPTPPVGNPGLRTRPTPPGRNPGLRTRPTPPGRNPGIGNRMTTPFPMDMSTNEDPLGNVIDSPSVCAGVPTALVADSTGGTIQSPGYPESYPKNCTMYWVIRARNPFMNVTLFSKHPLDLEKCQGCACDNIKVVESTQRRTNIRPLLNATCSGDINVTMSAGMIMIVAFKSDASVSQNGFQLSYSAQIINTNTTTSKPAPKPATPSPNRAGINLPTTTTTTHRTTTTTTPKSAESKLLSGSDGGGSSFLDSKTGVVVGWAIGAVCVLLVLLPLVAYLCTRKNKQVNPLQCQVSFSPGQGRPDSSTDGSDDGDEEAAVRIRTAADACRNGARVYPYGSGYYNPSYAGFNPAFMNPAWVMAMTGQNGAMATGSASQAQPGSHSGPPGPPAQSTAAGESGSGQNQYGASAMVPDMPPSYESVQSSASKSKKKEKKIKTDGSAQQTNNSSCSAHEQQGTNNSSDDHDGIHKSLPSTTATSPSACLEQISASAQAASEVGGKKEECMNGQPPEEASTGEALLSLEFQQCTVGPDLLSDATHAQLDLQTAPLVSLQDPSMNAQMQSTVQNQEYANQFAATNASPADLASNFSTDMPQQLNDDGSARSAKPKKKSRKHRKPKQDSSTEEQINPTPMPVMSPEAAENVSNENFHQNFASETNAAAESTDHLSGSQDLFEYPDGAAVGDLAGESNVDLPTYPLNDIPEEIGQE